MTLVVGETLGPPSAVSQRGLIRDRGRMTGHPQVITVQKSIVGKLSRREPFSLDV